MTNRIILWLFALLSLTSCIREDEYINTPNGNFEALWSIIDQRYCFFAKAESDFGLNWNEVHERYRPLVAQCTNDGELFDILGKMLGELRDGHVNLISIYGTSYYRDWSQQYPINFSDSIQHNYLGNDYRLTNGIKYTQLDDSVGYVYVGTFANGFGTDNLTVMLNNLRDCKGLILDIRNNSGGMLTAAEQLASTFTQQKRHCGYIQHKTGKGHNDFSTPEELFLTPSKGAKWLRPVVVLTNRSVYSAANHFVMLMRELPNAVILGDRTGGGSGLPLNSTLPNGWNIRFSACPILDIEGNATESGIEPDIKVNITSEDWNNGRDTMIERAKEAILGLHDKKEQ